MQLTETEQVERDGLVPTGEVVGKRVSESRLSIDTAIPDERVDVL